MLFDGGQMQYCWIYLIFPIVGSICAVLFYELVYVKSKGTQEVEANQENDN